jgi:hypothetical protein
MSDDFMKDYGGMIEGLINAYRILIAIEEGKDSVMLINTDKKEE